MKADILEFEYLPFIIDSDNAILLESIVKKRKIIYYIGYIILFWSIWGVILY